MMVLSERQTTGSAWWLIAGAFILMFACVIFVPLKGLGGAVAIGSFLLCYVYMLSGMNSAYRASRLVRAGYEALKGKAKPEDQRRINPYAYLIGFFISFFSFTFIVSTISIMVLGWDKLYEVIVLALAVLAGALMFAWYFQSFYGIQDEQLRNELEENRSSLIHYSALAGIALIGLIGTSLRLALQL